MHAGAEFQVRIFDFSPNTNLRVEWIDFWIDEHNVAGKFHGLVVGRHHFEPRFAADEVEAGVFGRQKTLGFELIETDNADDGVAGLDPFAAAVGDLDDHTTERSEDRAALELLA